MSFIYSITPKTYSINSASNMHTSYPAINMLDITRPRFYARTTSTTAPVIVLDLTGSATDTTIQAFTIENVNYAALLIEGATNAAPTTWSTFANVAPTSTDTEDGRRKLYFTPSSTFTRRFLRFTPSSLDAGETFFKIGAFGCWSTIVTLNKNFSRPYEKNPEDEAEEGGRQVGVPTPIRIRMNLSARAATSDTTSNNQFRDLMLVPRDRVCFIYENEGTGSKVYHVRRDASARISRTGDGTTTSSGIQFREVG